MKTTAIIFLGLAGLAAAQTAAVTKNAVTNALTDSLTVPAGKELVVTGTFKSVEIINGAAFAETWEGVQSKATVLSTTSNGARHGLIARSTGTAGVPLIAISESGAVAGKFYQSGNYASPALWIGRNPVDAFGGVTTPSLMVTTPGTTATTPIAQFCRNNITPVLSLLADGSVRAPMQVTPTSDSLVTKGHVESNFLPLGYIAGAGSSDVTSTQIGARASSTFTASSLVSGTAKSIGVGTFSNGIWDVHAVVTYTPAAGTTVTYTQQGTTPATTPATFGGEGTYTASASAITNVIPSSYVTPTVRFYNANPVQVSVVVRAGFSGGNMTASAHLSGVRIR